MLQIVTLALTFTMFSGLYALGWSEKNFLFRINFPGLKKVGIWTENMIKIGFAWSQTKMAELPPSSGLSDPNFTKFVKTS